MKIVPAYCRCLLTLTFCCAAMQIINRLYCLQAWQLDSFVNRVAAHEAVAVADKSIVCKVVDAEAGAKCVEPISHSSSCPLIACKSIPRNLYIGSRHLGMSNCQCVICEI